jgi:hypothetical protein
MWADRCGREMPLAPLTAPIARGSGLRKRTPKSHHQAMSTKSRETIYGSSVRASAERAKAARKEADVLACVAWNQRMLGFQGPAQPSPTLGDALNAGHLYLEVRCLGCDTNQTVPLNIVRRPKATPVRSSLSAESRRRRIAGCPAMAKSLVVRRADEIWGRASPARRSIRADVYYSPAILD